MQSWEWRIFFTKEFDLWEQLGLYDNGIPKLLEKSKIEKRSDFYFNVNNVELGLKERWDKSIDGKFHQKLELKIRKEKDQSIELWYKLFSINIKEEINQKTGLKQQLIEKYLTEEISNNISKYEGSYNDKISEIISYIPNSKRIRIDKYRIQILGIFDEENKVWEFVLKDRLLPPLDINKIILIEQTDLNKGNTQTICIESTNKELVREFHTQHIPNFERLIVGYPEYLIDQ